MPPHIIPIVEGHGEVAAVPILIRRIAEQLGVYGVRVGKPIRCPRQKLVKVGELERVVELAARKGGATGQILVIIDAESDCPAQLAPMLLRRARAARGDVLIDVVIAKMEHEAWFLGSLESLVQHLQIRNYVPIPFDPESIQGAKERLSIQTGIHYSETVDQPAYTAVFNMERARKVCPSFDKCCRAVGSLIENAPDR